MDRDQCEEETKRRSEHVREMAREFGIELDQGRLESVLRKARERQFALSWSRSETPSKVKV